MDIEGHFAASMWGKAAGGGDAWDWRCVGMKS